MFAFRIDGRDYNSTFLSGAFCGKLVAINGKLDFLEQCIVQKQFNIHVFHQAEALVFHSVVNLGFTPCRHRECAFTDLNVWIKLAHRVLDPHFVLTEYTEEIFWLFNEICSRLKIC